MINSNDIMLEQSKHNNGSSGSALLPWIICSLAAIFYCYEFLLRVMPSVMHQDFLRVYHINNEQFGWLSDFYYLSYVPMQLVVGVLMDRYGPRRLLTMSVLSCTLGAVLISYSHTLSVAKLAEFMMGFGSSFAFVGVLKLATNWLPLNRLSLVSGIATSLGMLGGIFGESLIDIIRVHLGWRAAWCYAGIIGLVILLTIWTFVHDRPQPSQLSSDDHQPTAEQHTKLKWSVLLSEFKDILFNVKFWLNGLIGCLLFLPISVFNSIWGVSFLQQAAHISSTKASNVTSLMFLGAAIGAPLVGIITAWLQKRKLILQVGALLGAVLMGLVIFNPGLPYHWICLLSFLTGVVVSAEILVFAIGVDLTDKKIAGTAVAATNFLVMIGCVIFTPLVGKILDSNWGGMMLNGQPIYDIHAFQLALAVVPISLLVAWLLSLFTKDIYQVVQTNDNDNEQQAVSSALAD